MKQFLTKKLPVDWNTFMVFCHIMIYPTTGSVKTETNTVSFWLGHDFMVNYGVCSDVHLTTDFFKILTKMLLVIFFPTC